MQRECSNILSQSSLIETEFIPTVSGLRNEFNGSALI